MTKMIPYERQEKLLRILKEKRLIKIEDISKEFPQVSDSTIRRDIKELEKLGKVESMYGGAVKYLSNTDELPISKKSLINQKEKNEIADLANDVVCDGDNVYVDSGSNGSILLNRLIHKKITIYTTNTDIFRQSMENLNAEIIVIGGSYNPVTSSLSGSFTEEGLKNIFFNKSFLGANGIDITNGVTTPNISEALKKRIVKGHSQKTYIMCDSSKFNLTANVKAFDISGVTIISNESDAELAEYTEFLTPKS
ncbi:DeoR/GlpR family DNA-binding transcription regulator [Companilactobacillus heilongjiangensis]|nr:DeoR/GlpR family DNA-binding transcription regulator [Companilactobacillus heilongjiangensis]